MSRFFGKKKPATNLTPWSPVADGGATPAQQEAWDSGRSRSREFGLGATFKEKHPDGTEIQRSAILAVGGTRDNKQAKMLPPEEPVIQPGKQTDYWANKRYGDKTQLPAPTERRAGPLPYPETYQDYLESEREREWSRSQ